MIVAARQSVAHDRRVVNRSCADDRGENDAAAKSGAGDAVTARLTREMCYYASLRRACHRRHQLQCRVLFGRSASLANTGAPAAEETRSVDSPVPAQRGNGECGCLPALDRGGRLVRPVALRV